MKTTLSTFATPGRIRRRLASALFSLAVLGGTIVGTAQPAHAASQISGCFRYYKPGFNLGQMQVQVQYLLYGQWYLAAIVTTPYNDGCITPIPLQPGLLRTLEWKLVVNYSAGNVWFTGASPLKALPGNLPAYLGEGIVSCIGCNF